jgi:hypothetical protein
MYFEDLLKDTLATLWVNKRRTLLTMFGIAWGIISITVMVAAGEGLGKGIQKNQETFGKDVMVVFSGRTSMQAGGLRSGRRIRWMEDDYKQVAAESPACKYVMPELGNEVQVHSLFNSGTINTVGSLPPFTEIRSITVTEGRFYNYEDNAEARNVAFLGSDTKKQLFAEREAVGATIWLNEKPYTVIGVMKFKDQNSSYDGTDTRKIFIPFESMKRDFPNKPPSPEHSVDRILAAPWSLASHPDCVLQLRRSLGRLHNFDPRDKEAAGIWDTVKGAEANRGGDRYAFPGWAGRDECDARLGARTHARNWGAHGAGGDAPLDSAAILSGNNHRGGAEWRDRADYFVRFLCAGESAAHAAIFCGFAGKLEAGRAVGKFAGIDCGAFGAVSRESRGVSRSYRSAAV